MRCSAESAEVCGKLIYTVQGLFLKRQKDVAVLYSKMLVDHFFDFDKAGGGPKAAFASNRSEHRTKKRALIYIYIY